MSGRKQNSNPRDNANAGSTTLVDGWAAIRDAIDEQSRNDADAISKIEQAVPTFTGVGTAEELQGVEDLINKHKVVQKKRLEGVRKMVEEDLPKQALSNMQDLIQKKIKEEIARQVHEEVNAQIGQFLKPTLRDQIQDSQVHLRMLEDAIKNTEVLRENATIEPHELSRELSPLRPKSMWWPKDLDHLCSYDKGRMKQLLESYGLPVQDSWNANLNRFLSHIGVRFQLTVMEPDSDDAKSVEGDQEAAAATGDGAGSDHATATVATNSAQAGGPTTGPTTGVYA
ncbi:hypothetical protein NEOLEDRAFT_1136381 [Neolentinus lepideus HHB14362 ss-1]|uniref:Uncharacterized protein n=1 Tax=Neolentinus lepideus HHB14362 ss-1 TaxID=1314782 RepID=A0A165RBU1_9AGAM|nr:hypothetical protein NEOLEDRAFT_1136381 [Neolentinus lepideus HHB14362 ss-1]